MNPAANRAPPFKPLPKPAPSATLPYRVTIDLSPGEWECLAALAERWETIPEYAASTALVMALSDRYDRDRAHTAAGEG